MGILVNISIVELKFLPSVGPRVLVRFE